MERHLLTDKDVTAFLVGLFGTRDPVSRSAVVQEIYSAQLILESAAFNKLPTLLYEDYRSAPYVSEADRWQLRDQIVNELATLPRLPDDDQISLDRGGALPLTARQYNRQAYILTGLPASGKSGIAALVADARGAAIIDSDYAKRKLPEYNRLSVGASLIHRESGAIVLGDEYLNETGFLTLLDRMAADGTNVVVPKIGDTVQSVLKLAANLKLYNYTVHLTLIRLDRIKATKRAVHRFIETGRYVPLSLIYDVYANEPILTYYQLKESYSAGFQSIGQVSTDVPRGQPCRYLASEGDDNPALLFQ